MMLKTAGCIGCALLLMSCALSQEPAANEARSVARDPVDFILRNGLRVRLEPADIAGEVAAILVVDGAGYFSETGKPCHLSHVTEHAIFFAQPAGSPERKLVEKLFPRRVSSQTGPDFMFFGLYPDPPELETALSAQAMRLLAPEIDPTIVERERSAAVKEITRREEKATDAIDNFDPFPWCAFAHAGLRGAKEIKIKTDSASIAASHVAEFHGRTFSPAGAMLIVAGDFDPSAVRKTIEKLFNREPKSPRSASRPVATPVKAKEVSASWDVASHRLFLAWPAPQAKDPAHPALMMFADVLNRMIRTNFELRSLTQAADPVVQADLGGWWVVSVGLRDANDGPKVAGLILAFVSRLITDDAPNNPLNRMDPAKQRVKAQTGFPMDLPPLVEKNPRKLVALADRSIWRARTVLRTGQSPEEYAPRIAAVTRDQIKAAVLKHLKPEQVIRVIVRGAE